MCFGPHEMTRGSLQIYIDSYRELADEDEWAAAQLDRFERLVKDIDNGELVWDESVGFSGEWVPAPKATI